MKLSVIVPCYNVAPFLDRCLLSITNQSLSDLEIICIDDASTDNTLEVLKMWAKNDLRIRVLENDENMGVGYARNRGIDAAQGEFVGFVDPDDWIDSDFYKKLIDKAEQTLTPVVCSDIIEHPVSDRPSKKNLEIKKSPYHWMYSWSAVYLRDFLNRYNLHFPSLVIAEDSVFEASVKTHMPKPIIHVTGTAYHYYRRIDGANTRIWSKKQTNDYITAVDKIIDIYNLAPHVTNTDYHIGVIKYYFMHLCNAIYYNNDSKNQHIAQSLCEMFQKLRYKDKLIREKHSLAMALTNQDPAGVIEVMKADRWFDYSYFLPFMKKPIVTISANQIQKTVRIFNIKILHRTIKTNY